MARWEERPGSGRSRRREPEAAHPLGGDPPDARGLLDAVPVRLVVLVVVGVVLALRHGCSAVGARAASTTSGSRLGSQQPTQPSNPASPGHRMSIEAAVRLSRGPAKTAFSRPTGSETDIAAVARRQLEGPPTTDPSQFLSANRATKPARVCVGFCDGVLAGFRCFAPRDGAVVGTRRARFVGVGGPRHGGLELWERV